MDWPHFLAKYCAPLWVSHSGEEPSLRPGKIKMDEKTYLGDQAKKRGFWCSQVDNLLPQKEEVATIGHGAHVVWHYPDETFLLVSWDGFNLFVGLMLATAMAVGFPPLGLGVVRGFLRNPKTGNRNAGTQDPWTLLLGCKVGLPIQCVCGPFFYTKK